jgi:hypothetical protein
MAGQSLLTRLVSSAVAWLGVVALTGVATGYVVMSQPLTTKEGTGGTNPYVMTHTMCRYTFDVHACPMI